MKTMKKILSVCLALVLMAAMFAISASADTTKTTPVGADNGVEDFDDVTTPGNGGQNINVIVEKVSHRYAVDLTFSFDDLTIGSKITWNVNDMKYDVDDPTLNSDQTRTIKITNRSDLPVYAYATATDKDENDGVKISTDYSDKERLEVAKATIATNSLNGTATEANLDVKLTSENWKSVAEYYATKRIHDTNAEDGKTVSYTLTTVTVTISKSATSN